MAETARVLPLRAEEEGHSASVLGAFRLSRAGGADRTPRGRKTRALLAYLLLTPGPAPRDRLASLFWGDRGEEQAKASLRQALYELRDLTAGPNALLIVRRDEVAVRPEAFELDLEHLAAAAAAGDLRRLTPALDQPDLTLLADLDGASADFDEWLAVQRTRRQDQLLAAAVSAGEAALDAGRVAEVRSLADALERADPLGEPAVRLGLRADRSAGDLANLHRRHRRFADRLRRELGAEPAPDTEALLKAAAPVQAADDTPSPPASPPSPPRRTHGRAWAAVAALALVAVLAAAWAWTRYSAPPASPTVAVLPFRGAAAETGGYFGAGVAEAVLDLLGRDPDLRVVGSASGRLLGAGTDPMQVARRLNVDYVLQGEARAVAGRTDVNARLVRVRDGRTVWDASYQRPAEDIFAVQNEIAAATAQVLGARIAPRENPHLVTRPEVYDRYLQARSLARERRNPALLEARRLLLEAAALDPDFAPGFAMLSQVTMLLADHPTSYGDIPIPQAQADARRFARRALQLAPELGEAYAAYGLLSLGDKQSLPFYERAVALDPQRPDFHRWLAQAYSSVGRETDALREYRRAAALDPLMWLSATHLVAQLSFMGRDDEAREVVDRFARLSSDPFGVARVRAELAEHEGRLADHLRLTEAAVRRWPDERSLRADLAKGWALLGENARAAQALAPQETVGRLALAGDAQGLAREARRMGPAFWQTEPGYWAFAEALVRGGNGDLLVSLYDAEFENIAAFHATAPYKALAAGPPLMAALIDAGRRAEAEELAGLLWRRLEGDAASGMHPAHAAYDRATILALRGHADEAIEALAFALRTNWVDMTWVPARRLEDRVAFRSLRGHPRLAALQAELDARINRERALLGLPPLGT